MPCPCGLGPDLDSCCGPILAGAPPATAEALMRARYVAYTRGDVDFIVSSHRAAPGEEVDREATERWSKGAEWLGLEIVSTERGGPDDTDGVVEFIARYRSDGHEIKHHERSTFGRADGRWQFLDGKEVKPPPVRAAPKAGRNDPCPCGSGKKFKRCHGAA